MKIIHASRPWWRMKQMKAVFTLITILTLGLVISGQAYDPQASTIIVAKAGETVESLAKRVGADPIEVAKFNGLLPNSTLFAGREIKLPGTSSVTKERSQIVPSACRYVMDIGSKEAVAYRLYFQIDTFKRRYDTAEVWTCMEPINPAAFRSFWKVPATFAYALQFVSIDCERARSTYENMIPYTRAGKVVSTRAFSMTAEFNRPIVPSSIGEDIKRHICRL